MSTCLCYPSFLVKYTVFRIIRSMVFRDEDHERSFLPMAKLGVLLSSPLGLSPSLTSPLSERADPFFLVVGNLLTTSQNITEYVHDQYLLLYIYCRSKLPAEVTPSKLWFLLRFSFPRRSRIS